MNNKIIGLIIVFLYFLGFHICDYFYPEGGVDFIKLRISIYCLIILLAVEYKKQDNFIEKVFLAVVFNNIYVLLFKDETGYTMHDIYFIIIFTTLQYIKNTKLIKKWLNKY